jgi:peptidoglycan-associated lipoprotein
MTKFDRVRTAQRRARLACVLPFALVLGCASKSAIRPAESAANSPPPAVTPPPPAAPVVHLSDDLVRQCHVVLDDASQAPRFDFDDSELLSQDRDALQQVAACVTTGPLKGRPLQLVGHADPRGTDQYNFDLGQRRSVSVERYLTDLGVPDSILSASSRGKLDSIGTDEAGWSADRRVDVALALVDADIAR